MRTRLEAVTCLLLALCVAFLSAPGAAGLAVQVLANTEECFFEQVDRGQKMLVDFAVHSGGMLDIGVEVSDPEAEVVYTEDKLSEGSIQFVVQQTGLHKVCFKNSMSTVTAKGVSFNIHKGSALSSVGVAKSEHFTPLETTTMILGEGLKAVSRENKFFKTRARFRKNTHRSARRRALWLTLGQIVVLAGIGVYQIYFLRKLFERK